MWNPALTKLALVTGGAIAGAIALRSLNKKKVFISFAVEDKKVRDFLVGQSRNRKTPFEFTDRSVKIYMKQMAFIGKSSAQKKRGCRSEPYMRIKMQRDAAFQMY